MSRLSYDDLFGDGAQNQSAEQKPKGTFKVNFFNLLKNDGDEIIVRFPYTNSEDFEFVKVHKVNKIRSVECIGDGCPLCAQPKNAPKVKFMAKLLVYKKDENQKIVPESFVWERPSLFAKQITTAIEQAIELGVYDGSNIKISDVVFRIKRHGVAGDIKTTYDISATNPKIFVEAVYPKHFNDLNEYESSGKMYLVKSKREIEDFLEVGAFPEVTKTAFQNKETKPTSQTVKTTQEQPQSSRTYDPANDFYSTADKTEKEEPEEPRSTRTYSTNRF